MALSASVKLILSAAQSGALDLALQNATQELAYTQSYSDGSGANEANLIFSDRRSVAASGDEDLDLNGALTGLLGAAANFASIKAVVIKASAANTNNVQVTRPAENGAPLFMAAGDGIALAPGEVFVWMSPTAAGKALTAGSADLLNFANSSSGSAVEYEITVIGVAAT